MFRKFATELRPLIDIRIKFLFNILRMNRLIETKFCIHIIIDKICVGIVNRHYSQMCNSIQFLFNILRMNGQNLNKFCIHIIIVLLKYRDYNFYYYYYYT